MICEPVVIHQCGCAVCQAASDPVIVQQHQGINLVLSRLSEAQRRWYVASLSQGPAAPSDRQLACISGLHPETIRRGRSELQAGLPDLAPQRQRQPGAGRRSAEKKIRP